jgi:hypothetical protein
MTQTRSLGRASVVGLLTTRAMQPRKVQTWEGQRWAEEANIASLKR